MRIAVFSGKDYEKPDFEAANAAAGHELVWFDAALSAATAPLARGAEAVSIFVNDRADAAALRILAAEGVRLLLCRCAGTNQVDLAVAKDLGIAVMRVPACSPDSIAEHAVGMILSLVRNLHHQHNRVRNGNFSMDGLVGFTLRGRTAGIVGTGQIGAATARILKGFGCTLLGADPYPDAELEAIGMDYVPRDDLFARSDIVVLTAPLTPETKHMVNAETLALFRPGSVLVNVGRGGLVDARAAIAALKSADRLWYLGLDVYEDEAGLFFENLSARIVQDDTLQLLTALKNCLVTPHTAWLTRESLAVIAEVTLGNATAFAAGRPDPARTVTA